MASYPPPTEIVSIFNEFFFEAPNASISMADVANNYLRKNTSDIATGFITFNNSLAVNGNFYYNGSIIDLTGLTYLSGITPGTATASKALVIDASSNISGIVGLSATNITGTLQTAAQPNITSIGTLTSLTATSITGTLQTAAQTNITSVGTLSSLTVSGAVQINSATASTSSTTGALKVVGGVGIGGALYTAGNINAATSTITGLVVVGLTMTCNGVDVGSNIAPLVGITLGTPAASKVLTLNASSQIAGSLTLTGNLTATNLTGTLQTAAQPNITSIGTLTSLTATSITGTLQTAAQPNITSIGTLTSLTATSITGTLQTAAQPNITSLGTLTTLNVSGLSSTSNTRMTTTTNYNGIMDTASIVLKQSSTTNGNKIGIDFAVTTNTIDSANTATCSIYHERIAAYNGDLIFATKRTAIADSALIEALRISSTGTCSIANTSSGFQLNLGASGTGINTNSLTTTSLTLGATAITATGAELNYLDLTTGPGTAEASKALVVDSSKNIATINNLSMSGVLAMTAANTTLAMTVPNSVSRSNFVWNGDTAVQWEYGMRGSSNTPSNALYWYSGGYRMVMMPSGLIGLNGVQAPAKTLDVNSSTGACLRLIYNLTSNLVDLSVSSGGILTIAPSGGTTAISGTTASSSNTTGSLTLSGGIGISNTTDATSSTNGGTFSTAGGAAIAKKLYTGDNITTAGQIFCTKAGQGFNHTDSTVSLVSYVNAGFANVAYFGTITASDLYLQANNVTQLTIGSSGVCSFINTTDSTASGNGSVVFSGGVGIAKKVFSASTITGLNLISSNSYSTSGVSTKVASLYGHQAFGSINTNGSYVSAGISFLNASSDQMPQASIVLDRKALDQGDLCIYTQSPSLNLSESARFLSTGALSINYGSSPTAMISCIGSGSYLYGTQYQRLLRLESNHATPVKFEVSLNKNTAATSTNECLLGTTTANDLYIGTDSTYRVCIKATTNYVGIGDNGSSVDKVFGILNGTVGSGIVDMRFGNALSTNNCFTISYVPTSSGSGLNRIQFDPYGTSGALTILAKKYVGIGGTAPVCPLDVAGFDSGLGILAPYQYAGATSGDGGYVASGTTTGVNINARFQSNVIFDDKIYIRSDRRLKKDIAPLEVEQALRFVNEVDPVFYRKRDQPDTSIQEIGYIAQDVMKAGFGNLITHTDNDKMRVEQEGDIENIQFNVEYTKVCAVLHAVIRDQQKCIESLTRRLERLEQLSESDNSSIDIDIVQVSPGKKFVLKKTKRSNV